MVIKGNGAVNTMEAVKINTKEKERTKVTYHKSVFSSVLTGITCGAAILALAILVFLVGFILIHGVKNLTLEQFAWTYNTENVTMLPAIINTVTMTVLSLLLAAPLGIFSASYPVSHAADRLDQLAAFAQLLAECTHMNVYRTGFSVKIIAPDMAEQTVSRKDNSFIFH